MMNGSILKPLVAFQGGGWYSEYGQRIAVFMGTDGLLFMDFDRDIDGWVPFPALDDAPAIYRDPRKLARYVFQHYLHGNYTYAKDRSDREKVRATRVDDYQYINMHQATELL